MNVQHVADAVLYMANLPLDANVMFMTVMAVVIPYLYSELRTQDAGR